MTTSEDDEHLAAIGHRQATGAYHHGGYTARHDVGWLLGHVAVLRADLRRAREQTSVNETETLRRQRDDALRAVVYAEDRVRELEDELRACRARERNPWEWRVETMILPVGYRLEAVAEPGCVRWRVVPDETFDRRVE